MPKLNADFLEELREDALMTVTDFSAAAGISAATYINIGAGKKVTGSTTKTIIEKLKLNKLQISRLINSTQ